MAFLEDKQSLEREDCSVPIFGFLFSAIGDDDLSGFMLA
jgi:hypothetical protein